MYISHIRIENFRSIKHVEMDFTEFSILVGQNNHGKTNFFDAIDWFDSAKKTSPTDKFIVGDEVEVEITYTGAQQGLLDMQNERNRTSIKNLIGESDVVIIKKNSTDHKRYFIIDGVQQSNPTGFDSALNDFLPKMEYVRATAKLSEVSKYASTTPMGQMLGGVLTTIIESEPKYQVFKNTFNELFEAEDSTARQQLNVIGASVESFLEKQFPDGTKVKFSIESPIIDDLLKNFETEVDDGVNTSAGMKGDGMQRAIMLAIIQAFAKYRRDNGIGKSFTFLLDEAELHLHPSAQRALKNALNDIVAGGDQVFVNTHSSVLIVDEQAKQSIFKVEKNNKITTIQNVLPIEKPYVIFELLGGSPSDLLLPRNFLIVEGHSESKFLQTIIKRFYPEYAGIHIISANGDSAQQERSMNAIDKIYCPLVVGSSAIYKGKIVILCDKAHTDKKDDFDGFVNAYKLTDGEDIFILPVGSLEEYYHGDWKRTPEEVKELDRTRSKVTYAQTVAEGITQADFESSMSILHGALVKVNSRSFNPL